MDPSDLDFDEPAVKIRKFPGSHLSSPLTYYPQRLIIKHFCDRTEVGSYVIRDAVESLDKLSILYQGLMITEDPSQVYYNLFSGCYTAENDDKAIEADLRRIVESAITDTSDCLAAVSLQHPGLEGLRMPYDFRVVQGSVKSLQGAYLIYKQLISLRSLMQQKSMIKLKQLNGPHKLWKMAAYFIGESLFIVFEQNPPRCSVLNYDQLVMLCDTVSSRLLTLMTCKLNDHYGFDVLPSSNLLQEVYGWGDEIIGSCHMNAFSVIGEYESIVTSAFVTFTGADLLGLGDSFGASILVTAEETLQEYQVSTQWTSNLLSILKKVTSANVLSELFGIRKHWGNPMVEATLSGKSVQDKLNEEIPIDGTAILQLSASFNRMIALEFIKRHHRWPECHFVLHNGGEEYPLYQAWKGQITRIPEDHALHSHLDWAKLKFHCNCVMQQYEDQLSTLSDKSVSLPVEELDSVYFRTGSYKANDHKKHHERRLLLEYMRDDHLSVMEIMKCIMTGDMSCSWFANSAAMKGTELKHQKARIFAVLTFELRQFFSITEDMIKTHLFPYNPHQTMTMSEIDLLKKLREITKQMDVTSTSRHLNVMHIIDFSKWNLRMRYKNTCLIFKAIDDFLGMPALVERSHHIFENMVNLIQDAYNPPALPVSETESDTVWRFHTRGWEGQRQKGWTLLTSALLSDLERQTGIHSEICGQGDNQTLLSQFPIPDVYLNARDWVEKDRSGVRLILDDFYKKLEDACMVVGLKVKTAETCRSLHYLNYGKRLYFNGSELSMTLKRISKAMTEANDAFPTTESKLKTSQGSSYAAGLYSNPSPWPYLISRVCTLLGMYEAYTSNSLIGGYGKQIAEDRCAFNIKFLSILSKIPPSLGGPSQQSFASFLCRGHPDPLCEDLVMLTLRSRNGCQISRAIIRCAQSGSWFDEAEGNRESLIASPYSLNICTPISAKTPLSRAVLPALMEYCRNKDVRSIMSHEVSNYEERLLSSLSTLVPFNPLIANDLFSRSIPGKRQAFLNGLKNATSLCRLVVETVDRPIINDIITLEMRQLAYWVQLVIDVVNQILPDPVVFDNHFTLADEMRNKSWGVPIVGVTVPHPLELFSLCSAEADLCSAACLKQQPEHILVVRHSDELYAPSGTDKDKVQLIRSKTSNAYLGSTITEGVLSRQIVCKTSTPSWEDSCRLNVMRQWICQEDSNLNRLLEHLISTRTDSNINFLNLATGHPSRLSYTHRASMVATKKTCSITCTSNMISRLYISSNRMGEFSSGDVNYHLPYGPSFIVAEMLVCLKEVIMRRNYWRNRDTDIYHFHLATREIPVVYDGSMDCVNHIALDKSLSAPPSQWFAPVMSLIFEDLSAIRNPMMVKSPANTTIYEARIAYGFTLLGDTFIKETLAKELVSTTTTEIFQRRTTPISIGDIKSVGLDCLVRVISTSLLLSADYQLHSCRKQEEFHVMCRHFLDNFSGGFWAQFTRVLIHPAMIRHLMVSSLLKAPNITTSTSSSLNDTFKNAICLDSWRLLTTIRSPSSFRNSTPIILAVPNVQTARYLLAKYINISIWGMMCAHGRGKGVDLKDVNLVSSKIYDKQHEGNLTQAFIGVNLSYSELVSRFECSAWRKSLPLPSLLDLSYPWIDKIRGIQHVEVPNIPPEKIDLPLKSHISGECISIRFGPGEVFCPNTACGCDKLAHDESVKTEFFFTRVGLYSLLHLQTMDVIMKHNLGSGSVILIGDREGEIAATLSKCSSITKLYVAGQRDISDYDPHVAGSYIPTSFLFSGDQSKLHHPSAAGVIGDPFRSPCGLSGLVAQLEGHEWGGLIVNRSGSADLQSILDGPLLKLLVELHMHAIEINWIAVSLEVKCRHDLIRLTSAVGQFFSLVHVCQPVFARPSTGSLTVLGQQPVTCKPTSVERFIHLSLTNHPGLMSVYDASDSSDTPLLFKVPRLDQKRWREKLCGENNLWLFCDQYISGWGHNYEATVSIDLVRRDLTHLKEQFRSKAGNIQDLAEQISSIQHVPRSSVLILGGRNRHNQVQDLANKWLRCLILEGLLSLPAGDVPAGLLKLTELLQRSYSLKLGSHKVNIQFQAGDFRKRYSGPLMGILGHLWGHSFPISERLPSPSLHVKASSGIRGPQLLFPISLSVITGQSNPTDPSFMWAFRSKLMSVLFAYSLGYASVSVNEQLKVVADRVASEGYDCRVGLYSLTASHCNLLWLLDQAALEIPSTLLKHPSSTFVVCMREATSRISSKYLIRNVFRIPWSGLSPLFVLFELINHIEGDSTQSQLDVDVSGTVNVLYQNSTDTGCQCYDCVCETAIRKKLGMSRSQIERLCVVSGEESVTDMYHRI